MARYAQLALKPIMAARLDLARTKGCDAVDPDNVDGHTQDSGFAISYADQLAYNRWMATEAHARAWRLAQERPRTGEGPGRLV